MSRVARPTDKEHEKGRVEVTKVKRYWAGKVPDWAQDGASQLQDLQLGDRGEAIRTEVAAPVIVRKADPRLARLAANRTEDKEEVRERHREIRAAEIVRRRHATDDDEQEQDQERRARSQSAEPGSAEGDVGPSSGDADDEGPRRGSGRHAEPASEDADDEEQLRRRQAVRER